MSTPRLTLRAGTGAEAHPVPRAPGGLGAGALDPWRLGLAVVWSIGWSGVADLRWLGGAAVCAVMALAGAVACGRLGGRGLVRRLCAVQGFIVLLWLGLPWTWSPAGLVVSAEGLALAWRMGLRAEAIALGCMALLAGMDGMALARAAARLGMPGKLVRLMLLTVRFIEVLHGTRQRLDRAMRARGLPPGLGRRRLAASAHLVALLLVHAVARAERVGLALRARGFGETMEAAPGADALRRGQMPPGRSHG